MNYSPIDNVHALQEERSDRRNDPFELTPEETRVLRECAKEGIINRGIPMGVIFGLGGLMSAKAGPLMSTKYGVKPAVIGLGLVGYFIGRFSYSRICFDRALQVPNGNLRRLYDQRKAGLAGGEFTDPAENYYATIEPKQDPGFPRQSVNSDIELPTTSSFDTTPSEYYAKNVETPNDAPPQEYTSYDDLRRQNRDEFSRRMYGDTVRRPYPQEAPVRRPPQSQAQSPEQSGGFKTKYGDVWDA